MIVRKSPQEIELMRSAGLVVARAFEAVRELIRPGVRTIELDEIVERVVRSEGCIPSFKGYRGFPASACISLNEEIVHGIPGDRKLVEGDLVKIDVGAIRDGYHGDSAWTFYVGDEPPAEIDKLMRVTEEALWAGIDRARAGSRVSDISHAVQQVAEGAGFSVVREYVGHGLGQSLHEEPQIPNYGPPGKGLKIKAGYVFAIEPMINAGTGATRLLEDGWTVVTADGARSAHFEHTVAVTDDGPEVLTVP